MNKRYWMECPIWAGWVGKAKDGKVFASMVSIPYEEAEKKARLLDLEDCIKEHEKSLK